MRRLLLAVAIGALVMCPGAVGTSAQADALGFFKNYFLTGDYVVGGIGLNTTGQGQIAISGVPTNPDTDIVAAYLYWQVVASNTAGLDAGAAGVTFRGYPLSGVEGVHGKQLGTGSPTCSASGGGTGGANGAKLNYTYRADVLRYFDVAPSAPAGNGKTVVNGLHSVTVPTSNGIEPLGASLVVVYRDPALSLSAIVLYDGGYTMNQANESMSQTLKGFYQSSGESAKLTHIVGSGQANKPEILYYNGAAIAANPFTSALGGQWDNPTFDVTSTSPAGMSQATTSVDHQGFNSFDCLNWAAVVYRTTVQDTDEDGLLDVWEESTAPLYDPFGRQLPNLAAMGAHKDVKDVFVELGYMQTNDIDSDGVPDPMSYGGVVRPGHSHRPGHQALKLMGDAFATAPTGRINLHFDVGPGYPAGDLDDLSKNAEAYLVPRPLARGGDVLNESVTQCVPGVTDAPWVCQFSQYPGTVGWKSGFRFIRDEVLNPPAPVPGQPDPCDAPGSACERRFERNRANIFHYAFFAHAIGLPESEQACLVGGVPADDVNGSCAPAGVDNPAFHKPRTNTGIADFPGSDILVTLGGFNDLDARPVGTPFMQASTLMHEFGHNAERRHGGEPLEQNCKPTYFSVMNYMYQLRGLLDDSGTPHLDFSPGIGTTVDETNLTLSAVQDQLYRTGWYAPLDTSYLAGRRLPAQRHCNGSAVLPTDVPMVRIDARTSAGLIDWDADGVAGFPGSLDVNFNGRLDGPPVFPSLDGSDDWTNLRLNQVGSRRNVGGLFVDPGTGALLVGPLSLDSGKGDLGKGDLGKGDLGKGDLGKGDLGKGDLGKGDLGKGDLGKGDLGKGDLGGGDLFDGDPNNPSGELDATTAADLAKAAPNTFAACVIGVDCAVTVTGTLHDVHVSFTAPNEGNLDRFTVYRVDGADLTFTPSGQSQQVWTQVAVLSAVLGQVHYSAFDDDELVNGASYTYFAIAKYLDDPATPVVDAVESDPSNLVTIVGVNDPPDAVDDAYATNEDTALTVTATAGVLANDSDPDTVSTIGGAVVITGPAHGSVTLGTDGAFSYVPAANFNGIDSFTYRASNGTVDTDVATVNLTVNAVNDAPTAAGDTYSTAEDTVLTVPAPGVLAGDSDVDGDTLSALVVSAPTHGTLTLNADGSFAYTPNADVNGADAFTYKVHDGTVESNVVAVNITVNAVNDAPVASGQNVQTNEDVATAVVVAATDIDSGPLTYRVVTAPAHGVLSGTAPSLTYTPAANYNGPDSFTFAASDGVVDSNTATVTITVTSVNDAPTATGHSYATAEDTPLTVAVPGVLAGASDVDGDPLTATLVTPPASGALALNPNGSFVYTPVANFNGAVSFTYRANDGTVDSGVATVAITVSSVNDQPTISDITDSSIDANANTGALGFVIGDIDGLTGVTVSGASSNTTLVPATNIVLGGSGANRTVTVTPAANQSGTATITVTVTDAGGLTASDTFALTVRQPLYTFVGVQNIPPPAGKTFKAGSSIPLGWKYSSGTTLVNSSAARFEVTVVGPLPNPTINNTDSGQSSFRYSSGTWNFNLQTKTSTGSAYPVGTYQVTVTSLTPGFPSSAAFTVALVK